MAPKAPISKSLDGPWEGENKIIIGIDIGTTQSGVAFAFMQNGASQVIHRVTKWPGQEAHSQQSKVPTLVWYDTYKNVVSFGAEAQLYATEEQAEDQGWFLAKHFKLHLHPDDMKSQYDLKVNDLPPGVSLQRIYSDFMGYLLEHTKAFFCDRVINGAQVWEEYSPTMEVIIAHPNGWGLHEQAFLRSAAVTAGFVTTDTASTRVRFVTEAEASVHYCIHHTNLESVLRPDTNFAICDAGGSTVNTTLYSVISASQGLKFEEKRASACVQVGGIFVDFEMEKHLRAILTNAGLEPEDIEYYIKTGMKDFESHAKREFQDEAVDHAVHLSSSRFNNSAIRARRGRMIIPGSKMQGFFDACIHEIQRSVDPQVDALDVSYILLVGGFFDNEYVRNELKKLYEPRGLKVILGNDSSSKAVADGAVTWGITSKVVCRIPRYSFGVPKNTVYDPQIHDPQGRKPFLSLDGTRRVLNGWSEIVHKGDPIDSEDVCRRKYCEFYTTPTPRLSAFKVNLLSYKGDDEPEWIRDQRGRKLTSFQPVCTLNANLDKARGALEEIKGPSGVKYWKLRFWVCIRFGGTELESYLEWEENGVKRTGPVSIILPPDAGVKHRTTSPTSTMSLN